jgi:hypothetical protein
VFIDAERSSSSMPRTLAIYAALALCLALPVAAHASTVSSLSTSFAPDRLGADTALTVGIGFSDEESGMPVPVSHAVLHLPAGMGIDLHGVGICPESRLQKNAGRGCPASSKIGSGSAFLGAHLGSLNLNERANLTAWRGPNRDGQATLEIAGQGLTPLEERVVLTGVLSADRSPYGQELTMSIPPIPTLPTEPDASTLRFSLTVRSAGRSARAGGALRVPHTCPAGGFPFAVDFTYADGSTSASTATAPCP